VEEVIPTLCKDGFFSCTEYIARNGKMNVNDELKRLWKEAAVSFFKILFQHLSYELQAFGNKIRICTFEG
jgi:hypothetical protein